MHSLYKNLHTPHSMKSRSNYKSINTRNIKKKNGRCACQLESSKNNLDDKCHEILNMCMPDSVQGKPGILMTNKDFKTHSTLQWTRIPLHLIVWYCGNSAASSGLQMSSFHRRNDQVFELPLQTFLYKQDET